MLHKKLQQQEKTIKYIRDRYKQKTGEEISMPKKWEDYLLMDQDECPTEPLPKGKHQKINIQQSFQTKFDSYQLPSRISYTKVPYTNFSPHNAFHMIESIELNNFKQSGFNKVGFRELLNRIVQMRCLKAISLRNNGIDQICVQEVDSLFGMKKITRIDLSRNDMGKSCLQIINKNFNHLEWLDISRNSWITELGSIQALVSSIRTNTKLFHVCLDIQDEKLAKQLVNYVKIKININSFALIDTNYDIEMMTALGAALQPIAGKKESSNRLLSLNFTFCYLETQPFNALMKSIAVNNTLIVLNLSSNHLMDLKAMQLCQVLESHLTLMKVDVSNNQLQDKFVKRLSECLGKNQILQSVDISRNIISNQGASSLYAVLSEINDTLESLGAIQTNQQISTEYIQKLSKALRINKISKDIRAQLKNEDHQLTATEIANKQTDAFLQAEYQEYELLEPISITNPLKEDPYKLNIWQFD